MMDKIERAHRALNRALDRYARREQAYYARSADWERLYLGRTPAIAMVKQARDLAGRLEAMVYDGVGL